MGFLRKVVGMSAVVACVALGVGEGQARAQCFDTAPDCEATMGQCGAQCTSCWDYITALVSDRFDVDEWCNDMCFWYGGGEVADHYVFNAIPDSQGYEEMNTVLCSCWSECPIIPQ